MTLSLSNRRLAIILAVLTLGAILPLSMGWGRAAIAIACIAALVMIETFIRLLAAVVDEKPHADPLAAQHPCPACDYSLRGLPASGLCPECGNSYDLNTSPPSGEIAPR